MLYSQRLDGFENDEKRGPSWGWRLCGSASGSSRSVWAVRNPRSAQAHREVEIPPIVQDGYVHGLPNRSGCPKHLAAFKDDGTDVALPKPLLSDLHDLRCELGFIWIHFMTKDRVSEVPRSIHSHDNHTSAILLVHPGALEML